MPVARTLNRTSLVESLDDIVVGMFEEFIALNSSTEGAQSGYPFLRVDEILIEALHDNRRLWALRIELRGCTDSLPNAAIDSKKKVPCRQRSRSRKQGIESFPP